MKSAESAVFIRVLQIGKQLIRQGSHRSVIFSLRCHAHGAADATVGSVRVLAPSGATHEPVQLVFSGINRFLS